MPGLRDMEILAALARHNHFARAAEACGISQPAFSARIRNLEIELGVPIVNRGNRFLGFTAEGETVLRWARRLLADAEGLKQDVEAAKGSLSGKLAIGVVPTALVFAARLPALLRANHPRLKLQIRSLSSQEIHRGLEDLSLEAGVTYLDDGLPSHLSVRPLYNEAYVLVSPTALAPRSTGEATWAEAAELPLCLLTRDMRNRKIVDQVFETAVGTAPEPVMETNALTAALTQAVAGGAATIAPAMLLDNLPTSEAYVTLPLVEPVFTTSMGLAVADRDPAPPAVRALLDVLPPLAR